MGNARDGSAADKSGLPVPTIPRPPTSRRLTTGFSTRSLLGVTRKGNRPTGWCDSGVVVAKFFFLSVFFVVRRFRALGACSRHPSWRRQRLSCSDYTGVSPSLRRVMADCCRGSFSWEPFFWLHSWFCADAERLAGQWVANRDRWGRLHRSCCACLPACEGPTLPRNRGGEKKKEI